MRDPLAEDVGERLNQCLKELSPTARKLMELRYHERVPVQVIAERLGRSASSVSVSLFRLRNALATCLGSEVIGRG
jgi:RNA polymerase sigma-70 factor (ECF subfamily)